MRLKRSLNSRSMTKEEDVEVRVGPVYICNECCYIKDHHGYCLTISRSEDTPPSCRWGHVAKWRLYPHGVKV